MSESTRHASCVAIHGQGVLLLGDSGSGKSDLALRLIDGGAALVADDQVVIRHDSGRLLAAPPSTLAGKLEVRGVGIVDTPYVRDIPLALVVTLVGQTAVERLPEPAFYAIEGVRLPQLLLNAFDASTPAKIRLYLQSL